jgi:hypothetical protein
MAQHDFPVITDGIDNHKIKGERTHKREQAKNAFIDYIESNIAGSGLLFFYAHNLPLKQFFVPDDL